LNLEKIVIVDSEGRRALDAERMPLRIGTAADCELKLPGPGSRAVAVLDRLDDEVFVQPIGETGSVSLNSEPLTATRRLQDGDVIEFFGSRIAIAVAGEVLSLKVMLEDSVYLTRPPELQDADGAGTSEVITAQTFRRDAAPAAAVTAKEHRRWQAVIGAALGILILVSYLLFSAISVRFEIDPESIDSFDIDGGWFRMPMGDRFLLRPGNYTARVTKEGYYDVSHGFTVGDEDALTIPLVMRKLPGRLTINTDPAVNAAVTVDDKYFGRAPYGPLELEPGVHRVSVSADRFLPFATDIHMPGLGIAQELSVELIPRWADVTIETEPPGATIYDGDLALGETPAVVQLIEGDHELSVVLDGFKAWDGRIVSVANQDQQLPLIKLEPADAELLVNTVPRRANVTVNGKYRGQSPVKVALSPGVSYSIGASKAGYGSATRRVQLKSGTSEAISIDLTAVLGRINLNVQPADAIVFVDGQERGRGSVSLELSAAPHVIEVSKPGYRAFRREVTPRPGFPQSLSVRLQSEEEIRLAAIDKTAKSSKGQVLRRVGPGSFVMGTSRREAGRRANEVLLPVTLSKPFFIGVNEVTNREFAEFRPAHDSGSTINPAMAGDLNPVVNVTWDDAVEYCNWLSEQEGLTPAYEKKFNSWVAVVPATNGYRLPTEAEWTWAIRYAAGSQPLRFAWGPNMPPKEGSGNFADQSAKNLVPSVLPGYDDGYSTTAPVGKFPANALGIFDGAGNAAEWVHDFYSVPTPGQTESVKDPAGPAEGQHHVIRGSSWRHSGITELRLSYRDFGAEARPDVGFRIARNVE